MTVLLLLLSLAGFFGAWLLFNWAIRKSEKDYIYQQEDKKNE